MSARGFKSVGWVAAVGAAALSCYMLSLRVATERNDLARVERQIVAAKQDIRSLQTELGTRGRLSQLERWNADVLALAAPVSGQYLENEFTLARYDQREQSFEDRAQVRMASVDSSKAASPAPAVRSVPEAPVKAVPAPAAPLRLASAPAPASAAMATIQPAPIRRAVYAAAEKSAPQIRRAGLIDDKLAREISAEARTEKADKSEKLDGTGRTVRRSGTR